MTKRCTAWHIGGRKRFIECRVCGKARQRDDASIVPYKLFAAFIIIGKVSLRRDEGIPPYSTFIGRQHIIKCSVGNGLDRSPQRKTAGPP